MAGIKNFADLKAFGDTLKEQDQARALEEAAREKRQQVAREEANVFRGSLGGVKPIPVSDRYVAPMAAIAVRGAPGKVRTVEEDNASVMRESLSDQFDVDGLLEDDPTLSYSAPGVGADVVRKMRKRHWPVQDELDLHGMTRDTARDQVGDFLRRAMKRGLRCVRVIHGKGYGSARGEPVLRSMVHSWLVQKDEVVAFCVANKGDGGHGALIVLLKPALERQR
ncbi:Smr/MutS family protein [Massilia psychrophila]|uniref:DNA mismatch repair protein MutS n=1 Tax=Massilia psychrophila TaxID=1603353 RepID=A0A2G8T4P0_9BURK|nr:Smr/MutS family protein [Massilia psychrophila]PIL40972.1 DNA mismatch repair protein MutS [Massilia psychrophila]GGE68857.1 DNA mismatch repair protein MutS [Massilia psychrophila]